MRLKPTRYSSAQSFAIPYGERGRSGLSSAAGAVALAVDRAARRGEDDPSPGPQGRLGDLDGADDVHFRVVRRPSHRCLDVGLGGEMKDDVGAVEVDALADVALDERRRRD